MFNFVVELLGYNCKYNLVVEVPDNGCVEEGGDGVEDPHVHAVAQQQQHVPTVQYQAPE